jgi:hypothetical protein
MDKRVKIGLYSVGGLAIAAGLFFGIRAIVKSLKDDEEMTIDDRTEYEKLKDKEAKGTLNRRERKRLDELEEEFGGTQQPGTGDVTDLSAVSFPLRNGSINKAVAQIQLAINQKHNNNQASYKHKYCCSGDDEKLAVDGSMGPKTMKAISIYYDGCCDCNCTNWTLCINKTCNCLNCTISEGEYNSIISGADVSDEALAAEGYSAFSGFNGGEKKFGVFARYYPPRGGQGQNRNVCSVECTYGPRAGRVCSGPCNLTTEGMCCSEPGVYRETQDRNFSGGGYSNFNVPGYGKKQPSVMGNFYKGKYDFVDDNRKKGPLQHSYGMGLFFSGN